MSTDDGHFDIGKIIVAISAFLAMNYSFYVVIAYTMTKEASSTRDISDLLLVIGSSNVILGAVFCDARWIGNIFNKLLGKKEEDKKADKNG